MARKKQTENQIMRYTGENVYYLQGVPTRDLSMAEFEALPEDLRERCRETGLYVLAEAPEPASVEK